MALAGVTLTDKELLWVKAQAVRQKESISNLFRQAIRLPLLKRGRRPSLAAARPKK